MLFILRPAKLSISQRGIGSPLFFWSTHIILLVFVELVHDWVGVIGDSGTGGIGDVRGSGGVGGC